MNLTEKDIIQVLKLVEESSFNSLQLECGDLKLTVSKSGNIPGPALLEQPAARAVTATPAPEEQVQTVPEKVMPKTVLNVQNTENKVSEEEGLVAIKAPMVGIFYSAPEPGAKSYVSVGSKVDKNTAVGIIEIMKVFNSVTAGIKGEIAKCLVEDARFVEIGQPLFLVRPDKSE